MCVCGGGLRGYDHDKYLPSVPNRLILKEAESERARGLNLRGVQKHTCIRTAPLFP